MAQLDPSIYSMIKGLDPTLSDDAIVQKYQGAVKSAADRGIDLPNLPANAQGLLLKSAFDFAPKPQQLQQVEVTGQRLPPQTAAGGNFGTGPAGTPASTAATDAQLGGAGATTARLNAGADPEALQRAADALYQKQGGDSPLYRLIQGLAASTHQGIGGAAGARDSNRDYWNKVDTAHTTGLEQAKQLANQKAIEQAQGLATAAEGNATSAQNRAQGQLTFPSTLVEAQNKAAGSNLDMRVKQQLNDPDDPAAAAAWEAAKPVMKLMGVNPDHFKGMSVAAIGAALGNMKPQNDVQKQYMEQAQKWFSENTARITANAQAGLAQAETQGKQLGNKVFSAATEGGTKVPSGMNMSVSAGPATMSPSPATTGAQTASVQNREGLRAAQSAYVTTGANDSIDRSLRMLGTNPTVLDGYTGSFGKFLSRFPGQSQEIKTQLQNLLTAQLKAQSMGQGGGAMGTNIAQDAERAANEIMDMSPKNAYNRLVQLKTQHAVNSKILAEQDAFAQQNGGQLTGYTPGDTGVPMYNRKTHEVGLFTREEAKKASKDWRDVTNGVFPGGK